jgi:hypothetical protein
VQTFDRLTGNTPPSIRPYIEQIINTLRCEIAELDYNFTGRLPFLIDILEPPRVVDGSGGFAKSLEAAAWHLVVAQASKVAEAMPYPAVDNAIRLQ